MWLTSVCEMWGSDLCLSRQSQHVIYHVLFSLCREIRESLLCQLGPQREDDIEQSHR